MCDYLTEKKLNYNLPDESDFLLQMLLEKRIKISCNGEI
jgi:hypothetical protein